MPQLRLHSSRLFNYLSEKDVSVHPGLPFFAGVAESSRNTDLEAASRLERPPDREDCFKLGSDAMGTAVFEPGSSGHGFDQQIIRDIPAKSGASVPGKICLPGRVVTAVTNIPVPGIPITSRAISIFQFGFDVLVTDTRCYKWRQTPINNVVVDIKAARLEEDVLLKMRCPKGVFERRFSAEGCTAEHEIGMDAEKIVEMPCKAEPAQAGVIHFGVH